MAGPRPAAESAHNKTLQLTCPSLVSPAGGNFPQSTKQPTALLARTVVIFIKPLKFLTTLPLENWQFRTKKHYIDIQMFMPLAGASTVWNKRSLDCLLSAKLSPTFGSCGLALI